jgi:hypothetical protein
MMKSITLLFCGLLTAAMAQGQIIHVPADYPTIQQGINAATNGDTVLVSDGTYYEQINFLGKKPLIVASEFLIDGDTNHIANTIIDGSELTNLDSASVVYFISGEDATSVLCGFTITGGRGTITDYTGWGQSRAGGGIWISAAGPTIRDNYVRGNRCENLTASVFNIVGGGIASALEQEDFWIIIENNIIDSNLAITNKPDGWSSGGGLCICNNCSIIDNIIRNNVCKTLIATSGWAQGAGAIIGSVTNQNKQAIIQNNLFKENSANSNQAYAGGLAVTGMLLTCSGNTFIGNRVESDISITTLAVAGMAVWCTVGTVISGNLFKDNYSEQWGGGLEIASEVDLPESILVENNYFLNNIAEDFSGAFYSINCPVILQNNVFSGNHAGTNGGALLLSNSIGTAADHFATLINNSFYDNTAANNGGAIYSILSKPLIFNSIFWNNSANNGSEIFLTSTFDTIEIGFNTINLSAIQGGYIIDGSGNINEDPLFTNLELLTISDSSTCVNAGIEEYYCHCGDLNHCPHYDIIGTYRPHAGFVDMGAYEVDFGTGTNKPLVQKISDWHSVYPNPFNDQTKISYELDRKNQVEISLYNINGEQIQSLLSEQQVAGNHELQFSRGNLPAGIYFYRIVTETRQATGRMILMK